jgi:uncharacterized protein YjiS (DUF1127 family)
MRSISNQHAAEDAAKAAPGGARRSASRLASVFASQHARTAAGDGIQPGSLRDIWRELVRYLTGSPRSRLRQLAALRELDDRMLRDIGVTREEAWRGRRR